MMGSLKVYDQHKNFYSSVFCCNKTESADRIDEGDVEAGLDSEGAAESLLIRESEVHDIVEVDDRRHVPRESNRTNFFKLFRFCAKSSNEINHTEEQEQEKVDLTGESPNNDSDANNVVEDAMELNIFSRQINQDEVISISNYSIK